MSSILTGSTIFPDIFGEIDKRGLRIVVNGSALAQFRLDSAQQWFDRSIPS
ncbi:hypothetical protein [Sphingomonas sp. 28-62-20]|uniref:hypothetical protein n=1 Tax=Sphingomonas sp. 28-62-20 TaxID=1970433 RepID=UPI0035A89277